MSDPERNRASKKESVKECGLDLDPGQARRHSQGVRICHKPDPSKSGKDDNSPNSAHNRSFTMSYNIVNSDGDQR